ncbi:MAG: YdeI/OmpD-associated family protein [Crocinitomicaceae bacterium]|nr:YdeI/OmpD-associated family protein [Crocinitomicaceae bacterium]
MAKTFTSKIEHLDKLRMSYISVSDDILEEFMEEGDKFLYNQRFDVTVNDQVTWQGGTVSLGYNMAYITFSKARMKKIGVGLGDTVTVHLEKNRSEYGFVVPEEFEEVLKQDPLASERFNALTKGTRRAVIYLVLQIKSSQKRIEKSIFLLENLKRAPEKPTMRNILGKDLP